MEISAKELRGSPAKIIEKAARGIEIIITLRGRKMAKLIPYGADSKPDIIEDEIFGLWKDQKHTDSVDDYVRSIRKGRKF